LSLRRVVIVALSIIAVAVAAVATALASPQAPSRPSLGGLRPWGGTEIRSLDPVPARTTAAIARAATATTPTTSTTTTTTTPTATTPTATTPTTTTPTTTTPTPAPHPDVVLSNERTFTRWAYTAAIAAIRKSPSPTAPTITSLRWYTEDGFPEIYLVLREHWDAQGHPWVLLRIPMRPNGRTGWVRRGSLDAFHLTHTLVTVDRQRLRMYFAVNGRTIWNAPVGVGKPSTPTPAGHFWIRERFKIASPSSGYWPYAFGTSDYSTLSDWPGGGVVGIHGPYFANSSIPGRISHGCIRLHPSDDSWLAGHIQLGTPLHVI
jgi:lipoprotein-anchoring transpeptidase ErfK/SrfK